SSARADNAPRSYAACSAEYAATTAAVAGYATLSVTYLRRADHQHLDAEGKHRLPSPYDRLGAAFRQNPEKMSRSRHVVMAGIRYKLARCASHIPYCCSISGGFFRCSINLLIEI